MTAESYPINENLVFVVLEAGYLSSLSGPTVAAAHWGVGVSCQLVIAQSVDAPVVSMWHQMPGSFLESLVPD